MSQLFENIARGFEAAADIAGEADNQRREAEATVADLRAELLELSEKLSATTIMSVARPATRAWGRRPKMPIMPDSWIVECDWCYHPAHDGDGVEPHSPGFNTKNDARETVLKRGWFEDVNAEEWACPDCRPKAEGAATS